MEPTSPSKKVEACDHKPLQECLLRNNNDRSKCMKEWEDFQRACREKAQKKNQECQACKE
ncbi:uncharacterized protein BYT42DRAFT_584699 [Radiomyces spectabilis]|uniref:uncharacterized protein n=1 Tax=Radiomyces spectabilis TaxID=64574 RepID=UPI00221ED876|nr:uncharacterized protein BYT42DRAFT_584699 [Radiomyces spectabilis]KAI8369502.1 hypothetical protein BYT42DRAFT_584699 [Radiomyces spectabilis]